DVGLRTEPGRPAAALAARDDGQGDLPAAGVADLQPVSGPHVHRVRAVAYPGVVPVEAEPATAGDRGHGAPLRGGLRIHLLRRGMAAGADRTGVHAARSRLPGAGAGPGSRSARHGAE